MNASQVVTALSGYECLESVDLGTIHMALRLPCLWVAKCATDIESLDKYNNLRLTDSEWDSLEYNAGAYRYVEALLKAKGKLNVRYAPAGSDENEHAYIRAWLSNTGGSSLGRRPGTATSHTSASRKRSPPRPDVQSHAGSPANIPIAGNCGRLYAVGPSAQTASKALRSFLFRETHIDIDLENAQPAILLQIAKRRGLTGLEVQTLEDYCLRRASLLAETPELKKEVIVAMNSFDRASPYSQSRHALAARGIASRLVSTPSELSQILQTEENALLSELVALLEQMGVFPTALVFDGLMVPSCHRAKAEVAIDAFNASHAGVYRFVVKPFLELPPMAELERIATQIERFNWENATGGEEKLIDIGESHADDRGTVEARVYHLAAHLCRKLSSNRLIVRTAALGKVDSFPGNEHAFTWKALKLKLTDVLDKFPSMFRVTSVTHVLEPEHPEFTRRMLSTVAPPLAMHDLKVSTDACDDDDEAACDTLESHLFTVWCQGRRDVYDFLLRWLSRILRGRVTKVMIVVCGSQGCGKSVVADWLVARVMGKHLAITVTGLDRVIAKFNALTSRSRLVVLEEVKAQDGKTDFNSLKQLITSEDKPVERKFEEAQNEISVSNYLVLSNSTNPVPPVEGMARRLLVLRAGAPFGGARRSVESQAYFARLVKALARPRTSWVFSKRLLDIDVGEYTCIEEPPKDNVPADAIFSSKLTTPEKAVYLLLARAVLKTYLTVDEDHDEVDWGEVELPLTIKFETAELAGLLDQVGISGATIVKIGKYLNDNKKAFVHVPRKHGESGSIRVMNVNAYAPDRSLVRAACELLVAAGV